MSLLLRGYHASTSPNTFLKKRYSSAFLNEAQSRIYPIEVLRKRKSLIIMFSIQAGSKSSLYNQIMASYDAGRGSGKLRHKKRRLRSKKRKRKKSRKMSLLTQID